MAEEIGSKFRLAIHWQHNVFQWNFSQNLIVDRSPRDREVGTLYFTRGQLQRSRSLRFPLTLRYGGQSTETLSRVSDHHQPDRWRIPLLRVIYRHGDYWQPGTGRSFEITRQLGWLYSGDFGSKQETGIFSLSLMRSPER